jgi:tetratricopeptide (TPR) repeat protein
MKKLTGILVSILIFTMFLPTVFAAPDDSLITLDTLTIESPEDRQVTLLLEKAESFYTRSLKSLDEMDVWQSVQVLEEILEKYPESVGAREAYFLMAEVLTTKIQTEDAYKGALKAYKDYLTRFSWTEKAWEAQYNIAMIQYLYIKDYPTAKTSIESLFNNYAASLTNFDDNMKMAKLLYAKILHKTGDFGEEVQALDEIELIDYKMDFAYQAKLVEGIKPNRILKDKNDKFIFMGEFNKDYPVSQLLGSFLTAVENVKKHLPGLVRNFPLEVYVYADPDYFFETTGREGSFGSGPDAQIFYIDGQTIEPLFAQVYSFLVNSQSSDLRVDFLEVGFINAFGSIEMNLDTAALELGISSDSFKGETLFNDDAFTLMPEKETVAAAFVDFLMTRYPVEKLYRIFRLMEPGKIGELKFAGSEEAAYRVETGGVRPETLLEGFQYVYGVSFDQVKLDFLNDMTQRRVKLDKALDSYWAASPPQKVKIDQSTPESILISYFKAIQAGDYDSFRKCTTGDLRQVLDSALELYKKQNILDKVQRWKMAIPYMDVKIEVVGREAFTKDVVVFKINLLKNGEIMEKRNLVAVNEKGKWWISETGNQ